VRARSAAATVAVVDYRARSSSADWRKQRGGSAARICRSERHTRVGNCARRLPEGEQRSTDAGAYAAEIGMPLACWQTVVKAHWRGGTTDERAATEQTAELPLREWRNWDALDLLAIGRDASRLSFQRS
jgi:hypothetical protein